MTTLDEVLALATARGRVCPQPMMWNQLHQMLPNTHAPNGVPELPLPLILGGWHDSSNEEKAERFHLHLRWADAHGALPRVYTYLAALPDRAWHVSHSPIATERKQGGGT